MNFKRLLRRVALGGVAAVILPARWPLRHFPTVR